jgi:hypothetical protein
MSESPKYKVIKVVDGKKVEPLPPKEVHLTNADFFRVAEHGLYALKERKDEYVYSNIEYNDQFPETLKPQQIKYLTSLFQGVYDYLDTNPLLDPSKHRITKALRQKTVKLGQSYKSHHEELSNLDLPETLEKPCIKLILFVLDLVESFHFFDGMITDIRKIPNRPVDGNLRVSVLEIILEYKDEKQTDKFPKYPHLVKLLTEKHKGKFKLSDKQYRNYRKWLKRGTYYWYIQP